MRNLGDPRVVADLVSRLERVTPDAARRWGTLTPGEMLCHLADASRRILNSAGRKGPAPPPRRPLYKFLALYAPVPWPKGRIKTRPEVDPRLGGTRPGRFAEDRAAAIAGLRELAMAPPELFPPSHFMFGAMSAADWRRWGYLHTDYHLRQFGF